MTSLSGFWDQEISTLSTTRFPSTIPQSSAGHTQQQEQQRSRPIRNAQPQDLQRIEYCPEDTYQTVASFIGGAKAQTNLIRATKTNKLFVCKHLYATYTTQGCISHGQTPREAKLPLGILAGPHPNIVVLFAGRNSIQGRYRLYMEYCSGGDLNRQIHYFAHLDQSAFGAFPVVRYDQEWRVRNLVTTPRMGTVPDFHVPAVVLLHVAAELIDALAFIQHGLHPNDSGVYKGGKEGHVPVIHGDIKPENILLRWPQDECYAGLPQIVLADFGAAKVASKTRGICGTKVYNSPEVLRMAHLREHDLPQFERLRYMPVMTTTSDIYQLGHVLHVLATYALFPVGEQPGRAKFPAAYNATSCGLWVLEELMQSCFQVEAKKRPTAAKMRSKGVGFRAQVKHMLSENGSLPRGVWKNSN
ncbi:hypothetical protein LTR62_007434 [Meristemomyces frigidus]|uniref:non-specific serine/threonine protein kinase n=1 Tax=Meristemomyces frigidus TaxID=1508187 RepID=A0AAN7YJ77_9PEZI|nr:hypothetical protein LTR62_007434 [Meristemomyces frigidus]